MTQSVHELLHEYHRRIDEAFLQRGTTPYRLSKNLWQIHGAMARELAMLPACTWMEVADSGWNYWETSCDEAFIFYEGTPTSNKYRYCPYCGRPIQQKDTEEVQAE